MNAVVGVVMQRTRQRNCYRHYQQNLFVLQLYIMNLILLKIPQTAFLGLLLLLLVLAVCGCAHRCDGLSPVEKPICRSAAEADGIEQAAIKLVRDKGERTALPRASRSSQNRKKQSKREIPKFEMGLLNNNKVL